MIFYFSGTGNTRWVALELGKITGERIFSISKEMNSECRYELKDNERIGFCFPVHGWQPPGIVRRFITKMKISHRGVGHYSFAVCTCGDNIGETMAILDRDLKRHGLHLESAFSITMPNTYVCLPFMDTDTEEVETAKLKKAKITIKRTAQIIEKCGRGITEISKGPVPLLLSYVVGAYFNRRMITDNPFVVNEKQCIKCGKCADVCPVDNIAGGKGLRPEWLHSGKCTCCLACYHYCPTHAILYGSRTATRGRYYFGKNKSTNNLI